MFWLFATRGTRVISEIRLQDFQDIGSSVSWSEILNQKGMRLKGKVILITGSYTGIGRAIAEGSIREGARVVLNGLEEEKGKALTARFGKEHAVHCTVDITVEEAPERLVSKAVESFGKLDALVNNAAIVQAANLHNSDLPYLRRMLEVNTIAPYALIRAALPQLQENKGCVVNIGSVNSWSGEPNLLPYSISKGALMTMSRNLGDSLFRDYGIRVNQVNPGWVLTEHELINQRAQGKEDTWHQNIPAIFNPSGNLFTPGQMASAVLYLLSDEAGPVSGQVLDVEQYPMVGRNLPKNW